MYRKILLLMFVTAAAAAVTALQENQFMIVQHNTTIYNSSIQTDNYINLNRQQYAKNLEEYDKQMEIFKQTYTASLQTISIKLDMLIDSLKQNDEKLNPLVILSDSSKICVNKYRSSIPTIQATKTKITNCINTATNKLTALLTNPLNTRNSLDNYYKNTFERDISNCEKKFVAYPLNYTICVTDVVSAANTYTFNNQKTFATHMDTCKCSGDANIKQALDCSYITENNTISAVATANTLIDRCLLGQDECEKCKKDNYCSNVSYVKRSEVNYASNVISNPFYGRYDLKNCLMLQIF